MSIIRVERNSRERFVTLEKQVLEIKTLKWESKGLWAYLLSRPDNWNANVVHLSNEFCAGKAKIYAMLDDLIEHGLCERRQPWKTDSAGRKFKGPWETIVYEVPIQKKILLSENQEAVFQQPENRSHKEERKERVVTDSVPSSVTLRSKKKKNINTQESLKAAERLWKRIHANFPTTTPPNLESWGNDIRLMHTVEKRSWEEIDAMIDFATSDEFWKDNILSGGKLREKYDTMFPKLKKSKKGFQNYKAEPEDRPKWQPKNDS